MLLPTSPPQVPVKEYVGWNHLKPIAIFKLFYLFSSFCKLYWADSHVHGPSSPPLIFMWLAQEGVGLCWSSEEIWWFTGAALLSKTMVTLQSTWRWNKCSFLYSTSFLQLIVVLLFSSEISSLMGMCWSIKSVHIFSTREEFISFVQMVQMRSMFSAWQITRAQTVQSRDLYNLSHSQRTYCISILPLRVTENILKREGSTSCQRVENKEYDNLSNTYTKFKTISLKVQMYFQNFINKCLKT